MNDRVKILHCADLHIGAELSFLKNNAASRQAEILNTLKKITRICSGQGIELLIIAGDLFDSNHTGTGRRGFYRRYGQCDLGILQSGLVLVCDR